jgi:hypothetical protein
MRSIKIDFTDFWPGFDKEDNYFTNLLREGFSVEISSNPDFLFYSVFGSSHTRYQSTKIFYTGENISPIFSDVDPLRGCHWAFSFDYSQDPRNYRLPHYLLYPGYYELSQRPDPQSSLFDRKFCSFVVSNGVSSPRNEFFNLLSRYKLVDSGGRFMNNLGRLVGDKIEFIRDYKFNICFENDAHRGYNEHYTTEKLPQALSSHTLPIYFGNTDIGKEFNPKSFIDVRNFSNFSSAVEYIIELDRDRDKYLEVLRHRPFLDNEPPLPNKKENIRDFLYQIFR